MRKYAHFVIICLLALIIVNHPIIDQYAAGTEIGNEVFSKENDELYMEIIKSSESLYIPPIDAKVDRVWKAIPGLNGVEVDIKASYEKMKSDGKYKKEKLVFKQIAPKVNLSDLPPTPVYKGHPDKKMVSFLINVAWGNEYLTDMLATLKKHNVSASFFLEGRWVQNNPELAKMIEEAGHEIGNHSYTHPDMKTISTPKAREEIRRTNEVIKATTNKSVRWFAPPSGSYRDEIVQIAAEEKLGTVMWTVDTVDWQKPTPDQLIQRVISKVHNGAMILMHPTDSTAKSLDQLIQMLKQKDLQMNTVTELLSAERTIETR
ncbi:putative sporulation protein (polysaccharide deacetylase family) [Cytobacillus eiseniae]|uniref:Sporulation protein (Polysaccharide deacetylase family) n=1 Tax=Cytobacillus eiseniae TaxID=762947 RepID=A0ABS4RBA0_9BACI|nr:polysaccharide deacetylase family protein [Cytobacillus eiseniae]MBP2240177.1 putative sporulation protein (polysaccharide deacetylase family) [Cytobacillus eiseniae]